MISSPDIDKLLRRYLSPILRESGFTKVSARKAWGWHDRCVWVLHVRAVGSYFSAVTGWPPASLGLFMGVYYDFVPPFRDQTPPRVDKNGRWIPDEAVCHMRADLSRTLDQGFYTGDLSNPAERVRKDIWWVARDGSNMVEAVENITLCFVDEGKAWFERYTDPLVAFADIESERDCYVK